MFVKFVVIVVEMSYKIASRGFDIGLVKITVAQLGQVEYVQRAKSLLIVKKCKNGS